MELKSINNDQGIVSFIVVIYITIIIFFLSILLETEMDLYTLDINNSYKLKSISTCESKIVTAVWGGYFKEDILPMIEGIQYSQGEVNRTNRIKISDEDLINGDKKRYIPITITRDILKLTSASEIGGSSSEVTGKLRYVNPIFRYYGDDFDYGYELSKLRRAISNDEGDYVLPIKGDNLDIRIKGDSYKRIYRDGDGYILEVDDKIHSFDKNHTLKLISYGENNNSPIYIDEDEDINSHIQAEGIIYNRGNLVINTDFSFNGIIISDGGNFVIKDGVNAEIKGILLAKNLEDVKGNISYDPRLVFIYGLHLPGFIELEDLKCYYQ